MSVIAFCDYGLTFSVVIPNTQIRGENIFSVSMKDWVS